MLAVDSSFGKFKILEILGSGSMGIVYRALDTGLDRIVALKMIREDLAASDNYRNLLTLEAKAAARIDSTNVVRIWDHGQVDSQLYISLELVDGPDLRIACENMSFRQKIELAKQLVRGLGAAHNVGLLHRDLKPENIRITHQGVLKIMDFGLAKQVSPHDTELALRVQQESHNLGGGFVGTISYASPEQLSEEPLTLRSDLFSVGVVLYEVFTGSRPFTGPHPASIVYSILNEAPSSPRDINPDLPVWLGQLILRCIAKRPVDRVQSADAILGVLEHEQEASSSRIEASYLHPRQTLTIIDLKNLSDDPSWNYFSQGFTEEVIREIGRRTTLIVSSQPPGVDTRNLQDLVDKCRSDFLITGSLLKGDQRIRMSLSVYRGRDLLLISGESYESSLEDLFAMLSRAAIDVASKLALETSSATVEVSDPLSMNIGAYEYYLKGRAYYQTNKPDDLEFAAMMYRKALELDPQFALAHAGLSDLYALQYMYYYDRTPEKIEMARREALAALESSPQLADGYRSLGRCSQAVGDFFTAEQSFHKAIDSDPKYALAYRAMAWLKEVQGDHDESMRWARKTLELAPLDLETLLLIGRLYMDTRKFTPALSTLQRAIELAPDYGRAHYELATVFLKIGAIEEALTNYELACKYKGDPNAHIQAGYLHLVKKQYQSARDQFLSSIKSGSFPFVAAYFLGLLGKLEGNTSESTEWLERSIHFGAKNDSSESTDIHVLAYRALALAALGNRDAAADIIAQLTAIRNLDGEGLYGIARAYAAMNEPGKANDYGQRALAAYAGPTESELRIDPHFGQQVS